MRTATRTLVPLTALGVVLALAGCAGGDEVATAPGDAPPSSLPQESLSTPSPSLSTAPSQDAPVPAGGPVDLTAVVDDGAGTSTTTTLTCDPVGGDAPQPQAACDQLAGEGATALAPVPADTMCTQVYGGPQTATVTGTVGGQAVEATFSRTNGCEIGRWDALAGLLGAVDADS